MSTDAIVKAREEHKAIRKLIRSYRSTHDDADTAGSTGARAEIVDQLVEALTVHQYVEDEVMHPRLRTALPATEPLTLELHEEHHVCDVLAGELSSMSPDDPAYDAKVRVMADAVERHLRREEQEWFPQVREGVGRKELQAIGASMEAVAEQAPHHPRRPLLRKLSDAIAT
ncbi:hemerythrin domain-containing protein [Streptomyces sp. NPDC049602]|uniref:hemerythrin domain-containing protein n=1 Tax=Streptomyces sp. NPDC049602 TaxID=3155504 RepID=UPI003442C7C2